MLKTIGIKKSYGNNEVLKGIDIRVAKGEIYGLIGANGTGKTTLFNVIMQLIDYEAGEVFVDEKRVVSVNDLSHKVGYIIDIPAMYEFMTAYEYLEFLYAPSDKNKDEVLKKAEEVLKMVGLSESINAKISSFSRGMKQRMGIAAGLIFEPQLILMDEPSSALDPQGRLEVTKIIQDLKKKGKTIVLSTHILNDIERICDKVGILVGGNVAVEGSIDEVLSKLSSNILSVLASTSDLENLCKFLKGKKVKKINRLQASVELEFGSLEEKIALTQFIIDSKIDFNEISVKKNTLEDVFISTNEQGGKDAVK